MAVLAVVAAVFADAAAAAAVVVLDELHYLEGLVEPQIPCLVLDASGSVEDERKE